MISITDIDIDELRPHSENETFFTRTEGEEFERLKQSIQELGILTPLRVSADMTIISGHQRYRAAQELGLSSLPAVITNEALSDDDMRRLSCIILEGKAEANYKDLLLKKEYIQRVRRINNKFNIMQPEGDSVWWINKSISISSNGNVHPGCMMPYTKIDADPMFNIMDCRNNFFEKVEEWCWRYPIWPKQQQQRETYEAYLWCKERGIEFIQDIRHEDEQVEALFAELTNEFEKTAIRNHRLFPYLTFSEIGVLSFCTFATCLHLMKIPVEIFKNYLIAYADLDIEVIEILTSKNVFELIKLSKTYTDKNAARARKARFKK